MPTTRFAWSATRNSTAGAYSPETEQDRMFTLARDFGTKYVSFLRFNPDAFKDTDGIEITSCSGPDSNGRQRVKPAKEAEWKAWLPGLETKLTSVLAETPTVELDVHYLYYDNSPAPSVVTPKCKWTKSGGAPADSDTHPKRARIEPTSSGSASTAAATVGENKSGTAGSATATATATVGATAGAPATHEEVMLGNDDDDDSDFEPVFKPRVGSGRSKGRE